MNFKKRFFLTAGVLSCLVLGIVFTLVAKASGTASLTLSPNSGSHDVNTTFSTTVYENNGTDGVDAVEADLTYDASKLQLVSIDTSSSAFPNVPNASGSNGNITLSQGVSSGGSVTGNQVVAVLNFKVLVGSGSTSVTFKSSSAIVPDSNPTINAWNGVTTGGTYTLTTPAPPLSSTSTPTPTTTSSSGGTTNTTNGSTSNSKNASSSSTSHTSSTPAQTTTSGSNTQSASFSTSTTTTQTTPSAAAVVTASGYFVAIKVVDHQGKPIKGAKVVIDKQTTTTDATGVASFTAVPQGNHQVTVTTADSIKQQSTINVSAHQVPQDVQQFQVHLASNRTSVWPLVLLLLLVLFMLGGGGWGLRRFLRRPGRYAPSEPPLPDEPVEPATVDKPILLATAVIKPLASDDLISPAAAKAIPVHAVPTGSATASTVSSDTSGLVSSAVIDQPKAAPSHHTAVPSPGQVITPTQPTVATATTPK